MIQAKWREDFESQQLQTIFLDGAERDRTVGRPVLVDGNLEWLFEPLTLGARVPDQCVVGLTKDMALAMLKALTEWAEGQGVRPDAHERTLGKLDAMERHLADMRTLVAKGFRVALNARQEGVK